jgi:hypothetical protein
LTKLLSTKKDIDFEKWVAKYETSEGTPEEREEFRTKLIGKGKEEMTAATLKLIIARLAVAEEQLPLLFEFGSEIDEPTRKECFQSVLAPAKSLTYFATFAKCFPKKELPKDALIGLEKASESYVVASGLNYLTFDEQCFIFAKRLIMETMAK